MPANNDDWGVLTFKMGRPHRFFFKLEDSPPLWKELDRGEFLEMMRQASRRISDMALWDAQKAKEMSYVFAEQRPPTERERTLHRACEVGRNGSAVVCLLVDENGATTYRLEARQGRGKTQMILFHVIITQAAVDDWKVD